VSEANVQLLVRADSHSNSFGHVSYSLLTWYSCVRHDMLVIPNSVSKIVGVLTSRQCGADRCVVSCSKGVEASIQCTSYSFEGQMLADDQFVLEPGSGEKLKDYFLDDESHEDDYLMGTNLVGCQPVNRRGGYALEAQFHDSITNSNPPTLWLYFDGNKLTWPQSPIPGYAPQEFMWWNDTAYRLLLKRSQQCQTHIFLVQCVRHGFTPSVWRLP
jgi:hypothetical protein